MRKKVFYTTIILPICLSIAAGASIITLNANSILHSRALGRIESEKNDMKKDIQKLKSELKSLERENAEYDKAINDNLTRISEIKALQNELDSYNNDIERASKKNAELEQTLASKQSYLAGLSSIKSETDGGKYILKNNNYKCPSDIPSGKYVAEGMGKLYLKDIANRRKDKIDLSTIDSNSYVFEIASGESVNVEGTVTLTEQKNE